MATIGQAWADGSWNVNSWAVGAWAGGTADDAVVVTGKRRRGAPNRHIYWWEQDRFYLPPHKKLEKPEDEEPLPHEAALADARAELAQVRKAKAAGQSELRSLAGSLGHLTQRARRVEKQIEAAADVAEVAEQYKTLGNQLSVYLDRLEVLKEQRRKRERADEEVIMHLLMELD